MLGHWKGIKVRRYGKSLALEILVINGHLFIFSRLPVFPEKESIFSYGRSVTCGSKRRISCTQNKIQASIEPWLPWVAPLFPPAPYSLLRPWNVPALVHLWACAWAVPLLSLGTSVTLGRVVSFPAFAPPFSRHVLWCRPSLWDSASLPVTLTQRALVRWSLC